MSIRAVLNWLLPDGAEVIRECRQCGANVAPGTNECPECGSDEIGRYMIE